MKSFEKFFSVPQLRNGTYDITVIIMLSTLLQCCIVIVMQIKLIAVVVVVAKVWRMPACKEVCVNFVDLKIVDNLSCFSL